jgi:integrase
MSRLTFLPRESCSQHLAPHESVLDYPSFASLKAAYTLAGATGLRKDEISRLTRGNLLWEIDGIFFADPTPAQSGSLKPDRDRAAIRVPTSKADQDGLCFGPLPIYLPLDSNDTANAASCLGNIELHFPSRGTTRKTTPLFFCDERMSAMSRATLDSNLAFLLQFNFGEAKAALYSFHSFRIGFACSLLAEGCLPATIQAHARWRSAKSLAIYARMNPAAHAGWITKASTQIASSVSARNLPTIDNDPHTSYFEGTSYDVEPESGGSDGI